MGISMRQAAELLGELGINRETARQALASGLAGEVRRTRGAHLVEEDSVRAVIDRAQRPWRPDVALTTALEGEVFVARLGTKVDLSAPGREQRAAAGAGWQMSIWSAMWWRVRAERGDLLPFVGLVAGLAVVGAEVIGLEWQPDEGTDRVRLDLRPPGPWFDELRGRRLGAAAGPAWYAVRGGFDDGPRGPLDTIAG